MPKKSDNSYVLPLAVGNGGSHGGGWTTSIRIADDGWAVCRNDTQTGGIRGPSDTKWSQLHRYYDNVPYSYYSGAIVNAVWIYDVDICKSNSNVIWMSAFGLLLKSTDRGASFTKMTTFKSGTADDTFTFKPDINARIGGNQLRIDPVNANYVAIGHPVDGGYVTTDGGATIAIPGSLPAPSNGTNQRRGVHWAFDRSTSNGTACQTVYCMIPGVGVYRTTAGLGGTWSALAAGGPTLASSMEAAGGKLYVCGQSSAETSSQLYVWNGTAWSQPSGVTGMALAINPANSAQVICMQGGGGMSYSADSGGTWNYYGFPNNAVGGGECPWLAATGMSYFSTGAIAWDNRSGVNDLVLACGIGTFRLANPPRTASNQLFYDNSRGIKQMLLKNATVTPGGTLFICGEDRPLWRFPRGSWSTEATGHGPNYNYAIRHGGDIDYAPEDENYVVGVYVENNGVGPRYAISTDNGKTYAEPGNEFTVTLATGASVKAGAGNVAVTGVGKFTWIPTSGGGIRYTLNGGSTWNVPVFKDGAGNVMNMTNVVWHWAYYMRKKAIVSDKATVGKAYLYTPGVSLSAGGSLDYTTQATLGGLFVTTDHGANWTQIKVGPIETGDHGFYSWKLRLVPGNAGHAFTIPSNGGGAEGPFFSTNINTSSATFAELTSFQNAEDVTFSPRPSNRVYPRITVIGKRQVAGVWTRGTWYSDDFNPASPSAATWNLLTYAPEGRIDGDGTLAGDMGSYPGLAIIMSSGGFYSHEDPVTLVAS